VVVRRIEDLIAWQLAFELEREIFAFTAKGAAWRDIKYREQIRDSSASAVRNTAEGFGRFRPTEFARFLEIAHGSLDETKRICMMVTSEATYWQKNTLVWCISRFVL
jgi:four helix bundle protein